MHTPRIYYPGELTLNAQITLDAATSHRLRDVLRLQPGAQICLFNGHGGEFIGELIALNKHQAQVVLQKFTAGNNESLLTIQLAQGIPRSEKMDFIIQKAVELGITSIAPLFTEHGNVQLAGERLQKRWQHWQNVAIHACEQCERQQIPVIASPMKLTNWLQTCDTALRLVLAPQATLLQWQALPAKLTSVAILVGPEGGLSTAEIALAQKNNFQPLRLGPRILRTETAALVALSCIQMRWGDLNQSLDKTG